LKAVQVLRLYQAVAAALVVVWIVNMLVVGNRPTARWYDVLGIPILLTLSIWLGFVMGARARIAADPNSIVRLDRRHYYAASLAVIVLIIAFAVGVLAHR